MAARNAGAAMQQWRAVHRFVTLFLVPVLLFLGVTGTLIQMTDLWSLLSRAPASDPNVRAMREAFDGPGDFAVRRTADYDASALPGRSAYPAMMARTVAAARAAAGDAPFGYVELRMPGDGPEGVVGLGDGHLAVDARNGRVIGRTARDRPEDQSPASIRNDFKHLHRMTSFGDWALFINIVVSAGLAVLIVSGSVVYLKLLRQRRKLKRSGLFWSAGGRWRSLHRAVSLLALLFLAVVTLSGAWLAVESLGLSFYFAAHGPPRPTVPAPVPDASVAPMLRVTLEALAKTAPDDPVKVVRLRRYGGYDQGVVVTGGERPRQLVFDARTGRPMGETEPGYPPVPFPFGWQAHQIAKSVHRGDFFGLPGRWLDLGAGLALIYLSVSGIVMYRELWSRRRATGRSALLWR